MRVKCILCDKIENIEDFCPLAKKLRNRPIHTYMCNTCSRRISDRTKERIDTGRFVFHKKQQQEDEW
jgi:uncharacterized protein YlaI